jgi:hypothetical protein
MGVRYRHEEGGGSLLPDEYREQGMNTSIEGKGTFPQYE